ncbi:hypothetical protein [Pararhizobium qamdonense]|uniref:hypothetical protein n=1 Tax=Pararhizobium qamdonense TaxID=3031126 RepID=UPI0023E15DE2|nr:hypothetical protein [Pararhizobium qamdonense]
MGAVVVAIWLVYMVGTGSYQTGTGMLLLYDREARHLTGSELANLTDAERADLLARLHPRALAYSVGMTATIILLLVTVFYAGLRGARVIIQGSVTTALLMTLLAAATGITYAIPPTALGQPFFNTSGIAVVSAIAVLILSIFVFVIAWGIGKMLRGKKSEVAA